MEEGENGQEKSTLSCDRSREIGKGHPISSRAGGIPQLTSFRVRMLSWMGLGKPTTVLVSLEEGKSQAGSRAEHPGVG